MPDAGCLIELLKIDFVWFVLFLIKHNNNMSLVKTERSFLNVYPGDEYSELIKQCIEEVKDELLVKPAIRLYGKTVH